MTGLLHELLLEAADRAPEDCAIVCKDESITYATLAASAARFAGGLIDAGLHGGDRVAVYLSKRPETVAAIFGATLAGGVFVPVNPLLKVDQLVHILRDCSVRVLVTTAKTLAGMRAALAACPDLAILIAVDGSAAADTAGHQRSVCWQSLLDRGGDVALPRVTTDADVAAIFYTSGSTGKPKGVVLSHRNMVAGARSVAEYLGNRATDRLLAVLPLSFDYGFSQLTTAFHAGASVALLDYLFPQDVIKAVEKYAITGLAGVPPLWIQLAKREWPQSAIAGLRYMTNSGGAMPRATLDALRAKLPKSRFFLMYGLTEAFRSTYLPPEELDRRPDSMGKAIPNAEVRVMREDGSRCAPGEPGELVHRGALVALGYWNDPERTAKRFRPVPGQVDGLVLPELAVWSGDTVTQDEDGFFYFVGRQDDMIKTSGYRVSPAEVETAVYMAKSVTEAVATGVPHPELGQAIVVVAVVAQGQEQDTDEVLAECRAQLPNYMIPARVEWWPELPRNPNGKLDRKRIQADLQDLFEEGH